MGGQFPSIGGKYVIQHAKFLFRLTRTDSSLNTPSPIQDPLQTLWRPTAVITVLLAGEALALVLALAPAGNDDRGAQPGDGTRQHAPQRQVQRHAPDQRGVFQRCNQ
mgnify:CR=1 FL=1